MSQTPNFIVMTVGKTHSGKTTFANQLSEVIENSFVLDSDIISIFLRENFPLIHFSETNREFGRKFDFDKPQLKYAIFKTILSFALENNFRAILSNTNSRKEARRKTVELAKLYGAKIIMVYFNIPEKVLLERIKNSNKLLKVLNSSKNFEELLINKQNKIFEAPSREEADYFFEIKDKHDTPHVIEKIRLLHKA